MAGTAGGLRGREHRTPGAAGRPRLWALVYKAGAKVASLPSLKPGGWQPRSHLHGHTHYEITESTLVGSWIS